MRRKTRREKFPCPGHHHTAASVPSPAKADESGKGVLIGQKKTEPAKHRSFSLASFTIASPLFTVLPGVDTRHSPCSAVSVMRFSRH